MTDLMILAGLLLTGPVTSTDHASVGPTSDGQYTYVSAIECRRGAGWLIKTAPDGTGQRRTHFYILGSDTAQATLAAQLCGPYLGAKR